MKSGKGHQEEEEEVEEEFGAKKDATASSNNPKGIKSCSSSAVFVLKRLDCFLCSFEVWFQYGIGGIFVSFHFLYFPGG